MQDAEYYSWQDFDSQPAPHDYYEGVAPTEVSSLWLLDMRLAAGAPPGCGLHVMRAQIPQGQQDVVRLIPSSFLLSWHTQECAQHLSTASHCLPQEQSLPATQHPANTVQL